MIQAYISCFMPYLFDSEFIIVGDPVPPVPFNVTAVKSGDTVVVSWL